MSVKIITKTELNDNDVVLWNNYLFNDNLSEGIDYNIGYNPDLSMILSSVFKATPSYTFLYEEDELIGIIQGCYKNNCFYSLPIFSTSGLYTKKKDKVIKYYQELIKIYPKFQIRDLFSFSPFFYSHKLTYYLTLKDSCEAQLGFYKSKLRSQIIKSQNNGLKLVHNNKNKLELFYNIYSRNLHKKGVPVMSISFFKLLIENYKNGQINIFLVEYNGIIIGTSLTLSYGDFFEVGWASTINKYNYLGTNMFMYNEMINFAIENKMKVFSFGRCTENSSTYEFKKQWQGEFKKIYYNFPLLKNTKQSGFGLIRKIYSKTPFKLANLLSSKFRSRFIDYT